MKDRIKVLIICSDLMGVGHFRSIWPALSLEKNFKDIIDVEINHQPNIKNIAYLSSFDIIHFHRHIGPYEGSAELFPKLQAAGTTLIMDIDDYWEPPSTHPLYEIVKKENLAKKISGNLKLVDYVTTTTNIFAEYIKPFNENVIVIPNALNTDKKMWKSEVKENKTGKCRISWIGGSSHLHDLELMRHDFSKLWGNKDLEDKFQIIMCGFDTRGSITEIIDKNGNQRTRPIKPHETVWKQFESIFTGTPYDPKLSPAQMSTGRESELKKEPEYYKWLNKIERPKPGSEFNESQYEKNYVRRWTLPLTQYAKHYDYCDVCLAPLTDTWVEMKEHKKSDGSISYQKINRRHIFNEVKSELKIIEAGMKKKVLIAQDFGIYKELIEDGVTGLLVKNDKKDWYKHMKRVINDPEYRQELAENLHNYVKDKYDISHVTSDRIDLYKKVMAEKENKSKKKEKV